MIKQISQEDFQEIETAVEEIQSKFYDLVCLLKDKNIKPREIEWMNTIGTILGSTDGITTYAFYDVRDKSFESWKENCLEICEDETFEANVVRTNGIPETLDLTFNVASGKVSIPFAFDWTDDISEISFEDGNGDKQIVCPDCGEGVVTISEKDSKKHCSNCG